MKTVWTHILESSSRRTEDSSKIYKPPTYEGPEDEYDTNDDEGLYCREPVGPRYVAGDAVEDVDEDKEDGDEDGHSARDTLRGNEEADPADNDKHTWRQY